MIGDLFLTRVGDLVLLRIGDLTLLRIGDLVRLYVGDLVLVLLRIGDLVRTRSRLRISDVGVDTDFSLPASLVSVSGCSVVLFSLSKLVLNQKFI